MNSPTPLTALSRVPRGNVQPILNEVAHALDRLADADETTVIDLARLPFSPGELDELEQELGEGELRATLDSLGESIIRETAYPGVWWLEHRNAAGEIVGRFLEITRTPDILKSQATDIDAGRDVLQQRLNRLHEESAAGGDHGEILK
jgi:hydrogenase-1 operon protein HyaF